MSEKENLACEEKEWPRYRATFVPNVRHRSGAVRSPEEREGSVEVGKEVQQEDEKSHELLRIDMGWGIHNRDPRALEHLSAKVYSPTLVRCVRRNFHRAVLEEKWSERCFALGRLQRGDPA